MALVQLHHELANGTKEFVAQRDIHDMEAMETFYRDTEASHPLPAGAKWLAVTEKADAFVLTLVHPGDHTK